MKLARFIQTQMDQLLEDFSEAALEIAPELKGLDKRALEDHAREMLEFIVEDLQTAQTDQESASKALGKAKNPISLAGDQHGTGRHGQGLSMLQTIQELRALRARVMKAWGECQHGLDTDDIEQLLRFNEAIDQLIVSSVASYSVLKEQDTHLLEAMLEASPDASAIFDVDGKFRFLNAPMAYLANTTARNAVGKTSHELTLGLARELHNAIAATVSSGKPQHKLFQYTSPSGKEFYFDCQLVPVFNKKREIRAVAKTTRDITERKQAEQEIWRTANFDSLTGIPNRRLFLDRLDQSLLEAERKGRTFALLFIDLDRFKQANDELGHKVGDQLLKQVAKRIDTRVREMDTFARLGGDEFTLILKEVTREEAKKVADELLASLEEPFSVDGHQVQISGSFGVALYPADGETADQLMHNADQAMYDAKDDGGHQVRLHQTQA